MQQDRKPRNKLRNKQPEISPEINKVPIDVYLWEPYLFLTKEARIYKGAKTASSINGAGKTGQLHVKNEIRTLLNTIHKDKLKMD